MTPEAGCCPFFEWDDEPPKLRPDGVGSSSGMGSGPSFGNMNTGATGGGTTPFATGIAQSTGVCFKVGDSEDVSAEKLANALQCNQPGHWAQCELVFDVALI